MKKNLVYLVVYGKPDYVKLFNLFAVSLVLTKPKREDFTLLVLTSESFRPLIEPTIEVLRTNIDVDLMITSEKNTVFSACFAKYEIFQFDRIEEFENILYLDTDVLIGGGLNQVFGEKLDINKIYCLLEGKLDADSDFYGRSLFNKANYVIPTNNFGFTAGVFLFRNSVYFKNLFQRLMDAANKDAAMGRVFSCFDQPYLNFLATVDETVDVDLMQRFMVNNPNDYSAKLPINHFPGGPGNFGSKFTKMSRFLTKIMKQTISPEHWSMAVRQLWLGEPASFGGVVRLSKDLFFLNNDLNNGFLITNSEAEKCYFLSIPGFELSLVKISSELFGLPVVKLSPQILDRSFLQKLLPQELNSSQKVTLEKQLNNSVNSFLNFSYAGKDSILFQGGTVDSFEFDTLKKLATEACQFPGPIIEIGTLFGFSTMALAIGKNTEKPLYTVDAFNWNPIGIPSWRHQEITTKALSYLTEMQNVSLIKSSATVFYENYKSEPPSMIFIDADHSYEAVCKDIDFAKRVNAAIVCGDDLSWPGVKQAVVENFGDMFQISGDMWIWRKHSSVPGDAHAA